MARTWLSIRVDLIEGMHAPELWPRPGRILLARPGMTFRMLAEAINDVFARWDRSHLHAFTMSDGTRISMGTPWDDPDDEDLDDIAEKLGRLELGEQFALEFDFGDSWMHLCTVAEEKVDPIEVYGEQPDRPVPYFGWGSIPDQYGRRWDGDDDASPVPPPPDPLLSDLPDLHYTWGSRAHGSLAGDLDTASLGSEVVAGPWASGEGPGRPGPEPWSHAAIQDLRGAVYRREAVAVVDLVAPRDAVTVAPTGYDEGWMLEVATGQLWPRDPVGMAGVEQPEDFEDPEAFIAVVGLGSRAGYGDMQDFIGMVTDERLADRLEVAIRGKGAFRRFKDTLHPDEFWWGVWSTFSSEHQLARARWWLAESGFRPATSAD